MDVLFLQGSSWIWIMHFSLTDVFCLGAGGFIIKSKISEFIRYTRSNNPQLAYALHVLNNGDEGSPVDKIMELAKPFPDMV
jgi:hypothetical protein